jgi:hypothetical protein
MAIACLAAIAALMPVSTARADRHEWHGRSRSGWTVSIGGRCAPSSAELAHLEYQRGVDAGWFDGESRGYDDGRCSRSFCSDHHRDLCTRTPAFVRGYDAGYRAGYGQGFERGLRELRCRGSQRIVLHRHAHRGSRW